MTDSWPPEAVRLNPDKRVLFLTKDLELIKQQLYHGLDLQMADLSVDDLLDDINTDVMTPAWVCFRHRPADIALDAYAGLLDENGERVFTARALMDGGFEAIVSGLRKGTGSSRETAAQCERWSGIRYVFAASFAPIHERNNINLGQLMGDHAQLERLQKGESIPLDAFTDCYDPVTRTILEQGGLFPFSKKVAAGEIELPANQTGKRGMTMAEKMVAAKMLNPGAEGAYVAPDDPVLAKVDGGYSHEFTTAQVHDFLAEEYGADYVVQNPEKLAVFEDHLLYADGVARFAPFISQIQTLRDLQNEFQQHTGVRDYQARDGVSPGICHQIAREEFVDPGDFIQATDSHTCMGGGSNALTYGVGATEYAALIHSGFTFVKVPETIRFELTGALASGCTAKDVILYILDTFAKREDTLNRSMEFGGSGLASLSVDERATLCNMATECTARTGICEGDALLADWLAKRRPSLSAEEIAASFVFPDEDAVYEGGTHQVDLSAIKPMVATPGDPTYGADIADLETTAIDIAYGGSCTAGKIDDFEFYARVCQEAVDAGLKVADGVAFFIQFGSTAVQDYARKQGWLDLFEKAGVILIEPGCGACIGCGPGVSEHAEQVTVSAINRNFAGRSGPGQLYLASPLTVAASAFTGNIVPFHEGMFATAASSK
ncbi:MAG: aconitase family protein [Planctomycetota bacterium]|jgi:3-isopropylmalate/(R)-2-methylmalate dehydratase large subunit|nr:aconitase family protein [Planctomycetota bacterium]